MRGHSRTPPRLGHRCTARRRATTRPSARRWCSTAQQSSPPRSATEPPPLRSATPTARVTPTAPLTWQVRGTPLGEGGGLGDWAAQLAVAEGKAAECRSVAGEMWGLYQSGGRITEEGRRAFSQRKDWASHLAGASGVCGVSRLQPRGMGGTWALCHANWRSVGRRGVLEIALFTCFLCGHGELDVPMIPFTWHRAGHVGFATCGRHRATQLAGEQATASGEGLGDSSTWRETRGFPYEGGGTSPNQVMGGSR